MSPLFYCTYTVSVKIIIRILMAHTKTIDKELILLYSTVDTAIVFSCTYSLTQPFRTAVKIGGKVSVYSALCTLSMGLQKML